jgi:hypothetical protein
LGLGTDLFFTTPPHFHPHKLFHIFTKMKILPIVPLFLGLVISTVTIHAEETKTEDKKTKPSVEKISEDSYKIGKITFNKKNRTITFETQCNLTESGSLLEYLLVHKNGEKVHESLLVTDIDPTNLNIALKLLNYKESQELFRPITEEGIPAETYPVVANDIRKAARLLIDIVWKQDGQTKTAPITDWLTNRLTNKPMPVTPWVYNGSYILRGKFKAKLSGSIFAIFPNEGSIANYPAEDRYDDSLWLAGKNLPPLGFKVTVTIKPWSGTLKPQVLKPQPNGSNP